MSVPQLHLVGPLIPDPLRASATTDCPNTPVATGPSRRRTDLPAAHRALAELRTNPDPAVVFGRLIELCVPTLCDEATVDVRTDGDKPDPARPSTPRESLHRVAGTGRVALDPATFTVTLRIPGEAGTDDAAPGYLAALTCRWWGYQPTVDDVALIGMLGRSAAGKVQQGQLEAAMRTERGVAANLRTALDSSRTIGAAVGVLMARRLLTYEQAFALLCATSQLRNEKVSSLAAAVLYTGDLPS